MDGKTLSLVLVAVGFSAAGQLLLKSGAQQLVLLDRVGFLVAAVRNAYVVSGIAAWTASTLCWLYVLRVAPLSRAYGLTSLTYVVIFLASVFLLGEHVRRIHVAGTILIMIGVACLLFGD